VNPSTQDLILISTALVATAVNAVFFVMGVLDGDRRLSRAAAAAFFVFGLAAATFLWRAL
jgi:hypothetical protein